MIRSLSESLQALLTDAPQLANVQIVFDRPVDDFNPHQPTVLLFVFDVRENMELRSNEPQVTRKEGQVSIARPPLRIACSYLVTAWPVGVTGTEASLQEQRLLSEVLQVLASYPTIPTNYLRDKLIGQTPPLPMVTARADGLKDATEFWGAIGARLRASLVVTATIGMDVIAPAATWPEVITSQLTFNDSPRFTIGGRVTRADGKAAEGASVRLAELGLAAIADDQGRYVLGAMPKGTYTLNAMQGAATKKVSVTVPAVPPANYDIALPSPGKAS